MQQKIDNTAEIPDLDNFQRTALHNKATNKWFKSRCKQKPPQKYLLFPEEFKRDKNIRRIFDTFDNDGSHSLDLCEMVQMFNKYNIHIEKEKLLEMYKIVDLTNDQALDIKEFKDCVTSEQAQYCFRKIMKEVSILDKQRPLEVQCVYLPLNFEAMITYLSYLINREDNDKKIKCKDIDAITKMQLYIDRLNMNDLERCKDGGANDLRIGIDEKTKEKQSNTLKKQATKKLQRQATQLMKQAIIHSALSETRQIWRKETDSIDIIDQSQDSESKENIEKKKPRLSSQRSICSSRQLKSQSSRIIETGKALKSKLTSQKTNIFATEFDFNRQEKLITETSDEGPNELFEIRSGITSTCRKSVSIAPEEQISFQSKPEKSRDSQMARRDSSWNQYSHKNDEDCVLSNYQQNSILEDETYKDEKDKMMEQWKKTGVPKSSIDFQQILRMEQRNAKQKNRKEIKQIVDQAKKKGNEKAQTLYNDLQKQKEFAVKTWTEQFPIQDEIKLPSDNIKKHRQHSWIEANQNFQVKPNYRVNSQTSVNPQQSYQQSIKEANNSFNEKCKSAGQKQCSTTRYPSLAFKYSPKRMQSQSQNQYIDRCYTSLEKAQLKNVNGIMSSRVNYQNNKQDNKNDLIDFTVNQRRVIDEHSKMFGKNQETDIMREKTYVSQLKSDMANNFQDYSSTNYSKTFNSKCSKKIKQYSVGSPITRTQKISFHKPQF